MLQQTTTSLLIAILLLIFQHSNAQDFKTQSVSIFKNGQSFFIKSGNVKTVQGIYQMKEEEVPAAQFGSLWFHDPAGGIQSVKSFPDTLEEKKTRAAQAIHELLSVNNGKQLKIFLNDGRTFTGVIEQVAMPSQPDGQLRPIFNSMVTLQTSNGSWVTFYANQVQQLEFMEKPNMTIEQVDKLPKNVVEVKFANGKEDQALDMMYLRNGLVWAPEYLLELKSKTKANLTLQAEIANDGEDLEGVDLNLVVGVPNFRFADKLAYLIDFLKQMGNAASGAFQQVMLSNSISSQRNAYEFDAPSPISGEMIEGSSSEDFFFYDLNKFSLPKGGRAMQRIFKEEIDIAHIYEANLPNNNNTKAFNEEFLFSPDYEGKIFHTIRVDNQSGQPWTTGSVFIVNEEQGKRPISQDMLGYTSHGGHSYIKVTEATDIKIKHAEKEIGRTENAKRYPKNSYSYDLVKVEGKIEIRNFKNEEINLNVRRTITGELGDTSMPWLKQGAVSLNGNPNKRDNVCWELKIGAGKVVEVVYTYEKYVLS